MKTKLNISDIVDYANNNGLNLAEPILEDLPPEYRRGLMEKRIISQDVIDWGLFDGDGRLVYCGGHHPVNEYTTETWAQTFDNKYRKTILGVSKRFMELWLQDFQRLQTLIRTDNEKAYRFNKLIGFKEEARIKKLTESDYWLLRRIRPCLK